MSSPPPPPYSGDTTPTPSSLARIIRTTLSYDTNLMLAAIISLLLVILFILLLHLYTRWFLNHARTRSHTSATVPHVLQTRLHHRFTIIDTSDHSSTKLGLPFEIISSLPLFVYTLHNDDGNDNKLNDRALECAICLSLFEENEIGRKLPGCNHAFHVECIDMWLHSHSTCPICRSSIEHISINKKVEFGDLEQNVNELEIIHSDDQDSQSRLLEIVTVNPDQIDQVDDISDMMDVCPSGSSKKLPSGNSSIGGKINPVSDMHEDESEA